MLMVCSVPSNRLPRFVVGDLAVAAAKFASSACPNLVASNHNTSSSASLKHTHTGGINATSVSPFQSQGTGNTSTSLTFSTSPLSTSATSAAITAVGVQAAASSSTASSTPTSFGSAMKPASGISIAVFFVFGFVHAIIVPVRY